MVVICGENMIRLKFMVVPEELGRRAYVPNRVKVKIMRPKAMLFIWDCWAIAG
jgi:hypothetical protein